MSFNWYFPKSNNTTGGVSSGDHFDDRPIVGFARELVQNALDAREDDTKPVVLSISYTPNLNKGPKGSMWNDLVKTPKSVLENKPFKKDLTNLDDRALIVHETQIKYS